MKILRQSIALSLLSVTMTFAGANPEYSTMSTKALQNAVEKLSNAGELPFKMGLELLKRWKTV